MNTLNKSQWIAVILAVIIIAALGALGYWHIRKTNERLVTLQEQTKLDPNRSKPARQTAPVSTPTSTPAPSAEPPRTSDFEATSPDGYLTRAMFTAMLAKLEDAVIPAYTAPYFDDVPMGEWYTDAVEWAAGTGIVGGIGGGSFAPDAFVSREQIAVMLYNYLQYKDRDCSAGQTAGISDYASISDWAGKAVEFIRSSGIVPDRPNSRFDPQGKVTNADADAVFERLLAYLQQTEYPGNQDLDDYGNWLAPYEAPASSPLPVYRDETLTVPGE